jgi:hypothetical protein
MIDVTQDMMNFILVVYGVVLITIFVIIFFLNMRRITDWFRRKF